MNSIQRLEKWFTKQCDGEWEHNNGIRLESTDNPGWLLNVDVNPADHKDGKIERPSGIEMEVENGILHAYCEPPRLDEMILDVAHYLEGFE